MEIKTAKGARELKEVTVNKTVYVSHQELKELAREDGIMFDFPHIIAGACVCVMCVVSNEQGLRCYGAGQAKEMGHAADLAFDNAVIDLYKIRARSSVEAEIVKAEKAKPEQGCKAAEEAIAPKAGAEAAAARKAAEEAAARKAAEVAATKKGAVKAIAQKAAAEAAAAKKPEGGAVQGIGYWYEHEPDWARCHSLTPEDRDDIVINYGPFKPTMAPSELKPGPRHLSQVLKYRPDFVEKLVGIQPPAYMQRIPQILMYCERHGIGLHATSGKAHDIMAQYGVREL